MNKLSISYPHVRLQFRDLDNALLADDFTLWLEILKASVPMRLSLHLAGQFDIDLPRASLRSANEYGCSGKISSRHRNEAPAARIA